MQGGVLLPPHVVLAVLQSLEENYGGHCGALGYWEAPNWDGGDSHYHPHGSGP